MIYNKSFVSLSDQELLLLEKSQRGRILFLDSLAMLHEILISLGTASPYPIVTRVDHPDEIYLDIQEEIPDDLDSINKKLSENLEIARALHHRRLALQRPSEIEDVTILIDEFIGAILSEYDKVRKPNVA